MARDFVHLHVHSQYSLLDGQASIEGLVDKAIADGMRGIALTDHGNMFGAKELYNYVAKLNGKTSGKIKGLMKDADAAEAEGRTEDAAKMRADAEALKGKFFKPILGCEVYVADGLQTEVLHQRDTGRHLIVLAKNRTGYKNLIKIVSDAWTKGTYRHPRTDREQLAAHREGLIVCSACLGGEIPQFIMRGELAEAEKRVLWYKETFGDDYYLELQRHKSNVARNDVWERQQEVNPVLIDLARKHNIKLVATNDSHFVNADDAEAHDRLICISTGSFLTDENRMKYTMQEWLKSREEMEALFSDIPEALDNTNEILDKVEEYTIDHAPIMPFFEIPESFGTEAEYRERLSEEDIYNEFTQDENGNVIMTREEGEAKIKKLGGYDKLYRIKFEADYLAKLAYEGAERRYGSPLSDEMKERIKFELYIMKTMGFPGYFLIVQDFINAAREKLGVSVGPGRGSAAGSCVAYCLGITQIDPVRYDLLFERFLNPDRISLPDIDIDFDDDGRADVLRYVTEKYGAEKVAHIITYGTMAAKSAIKDVARVEQLPLSTANKLANLVPKRMPTVNGKELKCTLKNCYEYVPEFQPELSSSDRLVTETLEFAKRLEGNVRNTGVHACGVIICRDDITDWVPVSTAIEKGGDSKVKNKVIVTQYEGRVIEETGLIKMDFLGLKTLSIIKEAVENIRLTRGIKLDMESIDITDKKTYELYCEGKTTGTFQFESAGMQKYLRELQPSTFEDLIAMNALYRPGPMDYIPDFIARKHGRSPIVYDIPVMEKYLKDTYGVTVYQEQVMLLSRLLANFTRGESDTLRKAMGKKLIDKMNHLKGKFLEGGKSNGYEVKTLEKIWADWEKFASYAFNKSHATCYSWVAFQTAYLKANYPAEYMAAVLSRNRSDIKKMTVFMDECKRMHIPVKGPDVNESFASFGVNAKGEIRFGLAAVKGVGDGVVEGIIAARNAGGVFESVWDLVERVPAGIMNRRTFESLALAGALDCFPEAKREDYFMVNSKGESFSEVLMKYAQLYQQDRNDSSMSLFGDDEEVMSKAGRPAVVAAPAWVDAVRLEKERELVGMYLSSHPLDPFYMELNYGCTLTLKDFAEMTPVEDTDITLGGMVIDFTSQPSRNGGQYGRLKVEDYTGSSEFMLFGQNYIDFHKFGVAGTPVLITGAWQRRFAGQDLRFNIKSIRLLQEVQGSMIRGITIDIYPEKLTENMAKVLREFANDSGNGGNLNIRVIDPELNRSIKLTSSLKINIDRTLVKMLEDEEIEFIIEKN